MSNPTNVFQRVINRTPARCRQTGANYLPIGKTAFAFDEAILFQGHKDHAGVRGIDSGKRDEIRDIRRFLIERK